MFLSRSPYIIRAFLILAFGFAISQAEGGSLYPTGAPAPTMKSLDQISPDVCISSLPYTISSPGKYCLSGDLSGSSGQNGITITSSDVVLDGKGFSLRGVSGSGSGIVVEGALTNVSINNFGSIENWDSHGVSCPPSTPVRCADVSCSRNAGDGFRLDGGGELERCVADSNGGDGVRAHVRGRGHVTVLKACETTNNTGNGLSAQECLQIVCEDTMFSNNGDRGAIVIGGHLDKSTPMLFTRCVFNGNASSGVEFDTVKELDKCSPLLSRCVSSGNGGSGLSVKATSTGLESFRCEDSSFTGNSQDGVRISGGGIDKATPLLMQRCVTSGNEGNGVAISTWRELDKCSPRLMDCVSSGNGGNGLSVGIVHRDVACRVSITNSQFDENTSDGMRCVGDLNGDGRLDIVVANSSCSGNGGSGFDLDLSSSTVGGDVSLDRCVLSNNGEDGCSTRASSGTPLFPTTVTVNVVTTQSNNNDGIVVVGTDNFTATRCESSNNGGTGIWDDTDIVHMSACNADNNTSSGIYSRAKEKANKSKCSANRNGNRGIWLDDDSDGDSILDSCSTSGNGNGGIVVSTSRCVVSRCVSSNNTGDGLYVDSSSSGCVRDCYSSSNTGGGIVVSSGQVDVRGNTCPSNGTSGIDLSGGTGHIVCGNSVSGNTSYGIHVRTNGNVLHGNMATAQSNPMYEESGVTNDVSPFSTAAVSTGLQNIGF